MSNSDYLSETFNLLNKFSWWVQNAPFSESKKILIRLDEIAKEAESQELNKQMLIQKIEDIYHEKEVDYRNKPQNALDHLEITQEDKLFSLFSEIMAYEDLLKNGFSDILYIKNENTNRTPEMEATKLGQRCYIEVKRIRMPSDEAIAFRSGNIFTGKVDYDFRLPLAKKIGDSICKAKSQLESQSDDLERSQKIIILDYSRGVEAMLLAGTCSSLDDIFGKKYFDILSETHDVTIWTRSYF